MLLRAGGGASEPVYVSEVKCALRCGNHIPNGGCHSPVRIPYASLLNIESSKSLLHIKNNWRSSVKSQYGHNPGYLLCMCVWECVYIMFKQHYHVLYIKGWLLEPWGLPSMNDVNQLGAEWAPEWTRYLISKVCFLSCCKFDPFLLGQLFLFFFFLFAYYTNYQIKLKWQCSSKGAFTPPLFGLDPFAV